MRVHRLGALLVACVCSAWAVADAPATMPATRPVAFNFRGMHIGDPLTDEFRHRHCPAKDVGKADTNGTELFEIGGKKVCAIYVFRDSKLVSAGLAFDPDAYPMVVEAYTDKFGCKPHVVTQEVLKTRSGLQFMNEHSTWQTDRGAFVVSRYTSDVRSGAAALLTRELEESDKARREAASRELGKRL